MQYRPQHPIGEATVVFLIIRGGEIGNDIGHPALLDCAGGPLTVGGNRAAPAKPQPAVAFEQRAHRYCETAGLIAAVAAPERHAIRYEKQTRQYRSSQLRDRRIALKINPAIE